MTEVADMPWITVHCADGDDWQAALKHILEDPESFEILECEDMLLVRARATKQTRNALRQARFRDKKRNARNAEGVTRVTRKNLDNSGGVTGGVTGAPLGAPPCNDHRPVTPSRYAESNGARNADDRNASNAFDDVVADDEDKTIGRAAIAAQREQWRREGRRL
jgi:hypothetical protein